MKVFYSDRFSITLPPHHSFPMSKYRRLGERLMRSDLADRLTFVQPHAATWQELVRVHDPDYIQRLEDGQLTEKEIRRIGLPWSADLVARAKRSAASDSVFHAACRLLWRRYGRKRAGDTDEQPCEHSHGR